jgi:CHAD domain-containing protein
MTGAAELALEILQRNAEALSRHAAAVRVSADDTTHHVHQARVATRRLRAALRLFREILPEDAQRFRDDLRWIANQFSPVRDLDVQLTRLATNAAQLHMEPMLEPYTAWLRAERQRAMLPLCEALQELDIARDWQPTPTPFDAPKHIANAVSALRRAADNAHAPPSPGELHRIRIRAKRARYTVEFFENDYGARATTLKERLVALQDLLGAFQDTVVSRQHIARAGVTWPPQTLLALGALQLHEHELAHDAQRKFPKRYKDAEKAWTRFASALSKS